MGNYVIAGVGNYVIENPSNLGNYVIADIKGLAVEVSEAIRAGTRATVWVTPVIVVWGEFAQVVGGDTVKFVHGDALARWLRDQPVTTHPDRVAQIAEAVASALAGLDATRRWSPSVRP